MNKLYRGDRIVVKTFADNIMEYIVTKDNDFNKFQLVNLDTGNIWNSRGFETTRGANYQEGSYITEEQIRKDGLEIIEIQRKDDKYEIEIKTKQVEEVKEVEINALDLERVISHTMHRISDLDKPSDIIENLADSIFDYLVEIGIMEEVK